MCRAQRRVQPAHGSITRRQPIRHLRIRRLVRRPTDRRPTRRDPTRAHPRDHRRRPSIVHRHRHRRAGGRIPRRIRRHRRQYMAPVRHARRVPRIAVYRPSPSHRIPYIHPVYLELHLRHPHVVRRIRREGYRPAHRRSRPRRGDRHHRRRRVVVHRPRPRRAAGRIPRRLRRYRRQYMAPIRHARRLPLIAVHRPSPSHRIPYIHPVYLELHLRHPHVVRRIRREGYRPAHRRSRPRRGDRHHRRRRVVVHRHRHRRAGGRIPRRIRRYRRQYMAPIRHPHRVPRIAVHRPSPSHRIPYIHPVYLELHLRHPHVVRRIRREGHRPAHRRSRPRRGDRHHRRRRVVVHRHRHRRAGGRIPRRIRRHRRQYMAPVRHARRVPRIAVHRPSPSHRIPYIHPVYLELHLRHPHVVRRIRREGYRPAHRRSRPRRGDRHHRRRRVRPYRRTPYRELVYHIVQHVVPAQGRVLIRPYIQVRNRGPVRRPRRVPRRLHQCVIQVQLARLPIPTDRYLQRDPAPK